MPRNISTGPAEGSPDNPQDHDAEVLRQAVEDLIPSQTSANRNAVGHVLHVEKLKSLRPRFLTVDPTNPFESPDLLQQEALYTRNLIPDAAFEALERHDHTTYEEMVRRGGMLNRFHPCEDELEHYDQQYESVRDQIVWDLLKDPMHPERSLSGRPGTYHLLGLFDASEVLHASLSFRLPPHPVDFQSIDAYQNALQEYTRYVEATLLDQQKINSREMQYNKSWNVNLTRSQLDRTWEVDTYNVEPGWGGAASIATRNMLKFVKQRFGSLLQMSYCYRYLGLTTTDELGHTVAVGPNRGSESFLEKIGYRNMAVREDDAEVVVRKLPDGNTHVFKPRWQYMYNGPDRIERDLARYMRNKGLLAENESLL